MSNKDSAGLLNAKHPCFGRASCSKLASVAPLGAHCCRQPMTHRVLDSRLPDQHLDSRSTRRLQNQRARHIGLPGRSLCKTKTMLGAGTSKPDSFHSLSEVFVLGQQLYKFKMPTFSFGVHPHSAIPEQGWHHVLTTDSIPAYVCDSCCALLPFTIHCGAKFELTAHSHTTPSRFAHVVKGCSAALACRVHAGSSIGLWCLFY